jgi:hypothetical protein
MIIHPTILNDINTDVRQMLADAAAAHVETGRKSTVTLKLTISRDRETQKRQVRARVSAVIPEGVDDSHTRKGEPSLLLSVSDDRPGQTRIET